MFIEATTQTLEKHLVIQNLQILSKPHRGGILVATNFRKSNKGPEGRHYPFNLNLQRKYRPYKGLGKIIILSRYQNIGLTGLADE